MRNECARVSGLRRPDRTADSARNQGGVRERAGHLVRRGLGFPVGVLVSGRDLAVPLWAMRTSSARKCKTGFGVGGSRGRMV